MIRFIEMFPTFNDFDISVSQFFRTESKFSIEDMYNNLRLLRGNMFLRVTDRHSALQDFYTQYELNINRLNARFTLLEHELLSLEDGVKETDNTSRDNSSNNVSNVFDRPQFTDIETNNTRRDISDNTLSSIFERIRITGQTVNEMEKANRLLNNFQQFNDIEVIEIFDKLFVNIL